MLPVQTENRQLQPLPPDDTVGGLLALPLARILPLTAGGRAEGYGKTGDYILAAAVQGSLTVSAHSQYALLDPGQAFLMASPGAYTLQGVSDTLAMAVLLQGELVPRLLEGRLGREGELFPAGAALVRETVLALAVLEEEQGRAPGLAASALAYSMLLRLRALPRHTGQSTGSPLVEAALAIIQEEFPFLEGVEELAERLEVSAAHLSRVFSKKTGISPGRHITHTRVEYAKLLLQDPDTSISYVAQASGFANANYFAKVFRKETGMSPSEYLESAPRPPGGKITHFGI